MHHYIHSYKKTTVFTITLNKTYKWEKNHLLSGKTTDEELDENNQKQQRKKVQTFMYCARAIDPTMLMALHSLAAVQTKR